MEDPTRPTLKLQSKRITCSVCGYTYDEEFFTDGICHSCVKDLKEQEIALQEQQAHPEKILRKWGVPKKHLDSSFENYNGGEEVKKFLTEASKHIDDVLLCGKTGCGKTHLAVAMMRRKVITAPKPFDYYYERLQAIFITVPELLFEIRNTFKNGGGGDTEETIVNKYAGVPLLVLDDLGAEKVSEWAESTLYLIIDRRNRNQKWTIVTSNLTLEQIEDSLGARIASRLADMKVVNIKLPDYRKKRA